MDGVAGRSPWRASTTGLCALPDRAAYHRSADRRRRRFAWLGVLSLAALVAYLWGSWRLLDVSDEARPVFILTGWGVLRDTIRLYGRAQIIFQATVGTLGAAIVVAVATQGFRAVRVWGRLGGLVVGIAGLLAAVPLGVAAVVVAVNAAAWLLATLFVMLIGLALLVRLALGGRR
jgi:hypothetical protein